MALFDPDGDEPSEIILPDGSSATEVRDPDGTVVWTAGADVTIIEDWEGGDTSNWGDGGGLTVAQEQPYDGVYAAYGSEGGGNQRVWDYEGTHDNLTYPRIGDRMRCFFYYPTAGADVSDTIRPRLGYGGEWGSNYLLQANLNYENVRLWKNGTGTVIAGPASYTYPGGEWWALEAEWGTDETDTTSPTHTCRVVNYSDPNNPVVEAEIQADDAEIDDTSSGLYWAAWNSGTLGRLYIDRLVYY